MSATPEEHRLTRIIASAVSLTLLVGACSGGTSDDGDAGSADDNAAADEEPAPEARCSRDVAASLPEGFDPESCWAVVGVIDPVLVDDRVFAVVLDNDGRAGTAVVGFDPATGDSVWTSGSLPGPVSEIARAEVAGEPGVAVLVAVSDEGDAVTAPSESWDYLAWPVDAGDDGSGEEPSPAAIDLRIGPSSVRFDDIVWTDQGLLIDGQHLLRPVDDQFLVVEERDFEIGNTDKLVGPSGDVLLWYVMDTRVISEDPSNHPVGGWRASRPDGTVAWETTIADPSEPGASPDDETVNIPVLVGGYVLNVVVTGGVDGTYEVEWLETATGEEARPEAEDLAGAVALGVQGDLLTIGTTAWVSPDGEHLFVTWGNGSLVVDVEAGQATPIESDYEITFNGIDEDVAYGSTDNGRLTVDLATGEVTSVEGALLVPLELDDRYGVFRITSRGGSTVSGLAVVRRTH